MDLQEVKDSAPELAQYGEMQFIVEGKKGPKLLGKCFGMGHSGISMINNEKVLASRAFVTPRWFDHHDR